MLMSCSINLADSIILVLFLLLISKHILTNLHASLKVVVDLQCEVVIYVYSVCTFSSCEKKKKKCISG